jgi:hypothetical protein
MISDKQVADKISLEVNRGYWSVDNHFFFDKSECLRHASRIGNLDVKFHYFDEFYNSLKWEEEPTEDIKYLYRKRAEQLRNKYDYIAIAYSGGADSSAVIDSFVDNGIHIDEIITSYPIEAIEKLKNTFHPLDKSPKNLMFEYTEAVVPKLEYVCSRAHKTKITVLDYTKTAIELNNSNVNSTIFSAKHYLINARLSDVNEKNKNSCVLIGIDKPRIGYNINHKRFGVFFDDTSTSWGDYTGGLLSDIRPTTEYFYYTLDMPSIIIKQTHNIIKKIKPIVNENQNYQIHDLNDLYYKRGNNLVLKVHHNFFKKILYPDWNTDIFQARKPTSVFFQESEYWFTNTNLTDKKTKDYHFGQVIESCDGILDHFIVRGNSGLPLKLIDMSTKPIPICL